MRHRWPLLLAASFAFGLAASWQRWVNPVIDTGREMNQPLRLAAGETLYRGVRHLYGPLSPWLHAGLYRVFGPSLDVLYADGVVCALLIVALVYHLGRRVMDPTAAGAAALLVTWMCAFKPAGNYIFPYSFNALHGTLLSLAALALIADAMEQRSVSRFLGAGVLAGVTVLAKTEMGVGAIAAGVVGAALCQRRAIVAFLIPAVLLPAIVYTAIAAHVGWRTLVVDSWLLGYNVPPPVRLFNASVSGFDHPLASIERMLVALVKVGLLGMMVAAVALYGAGSASERRRAWTLLAAALLLMALAGATTGLDWDRGPFMAMPLLLVILIVVFARRRAPLPVLYAVFALAQLARILLHVRSGGAYGSFLLPVSIVLFTYAWVELFPALFRDGDVRRLARALALGLLLAGAAGTAVTVAVRYRRADTTRVSTPRGTLIAQPDVGTAWNEALAFVAAHTRPGDPIAVLPEGTSLTFLSGRRNPLREEIVTPGYLDEAGEARAIAQIDRAGTNLILIVDRPTREFGAETFGRDYDRALMQWIASRYEPCGTFGPASLVVAYCRVPVRA